MTDLDVIEQLKSAVGPAPEPPADRLAAVRTLAGVERRRRWTEAIGTAAMSVAIVGGIVAVTGAGVGAPPRPHGVLAAAAANAKDARTMRFVFTMGKTGVSYSSGAPMAVTYTGEVDFRRRAMRMSGSGFGFRQGDEIVVLRDTAYVELSEEYAALRSETQGKRWLRVDTKDDDPFSRPDEMFLELREWASADPVEVGREGVRGVATTRYRFDVLKLPEGHEGSAVASIWIDDDGLPRRVEIDFTTEDDGAFQMTSEYFDYGADIGRITAPPASDVVDKDEIKRDDDD